DDEIGHSDDEDDDDDDDEDDDDDDDDDAGQDIFFDDKGNPVDAEGNLIDISTLVGSDSDEDDDEDGEDDENEDDEEEAAALREFIEAEKNKRKAAVAEPKKAPKKAKIEEHSDDHKEEEKPKKVQDKKEKNKREEKKEAETKKVVKKADETKKDNKDKKKDDKQDKESEPKSKITTHKNGLIVEDVAEGKGPIAKAGNKVGVRYVGKLTNGKVFDSNTSGKAFEFKLGKGDVIKGWDIGVNGMRVGGARKLTIPPALAYGSQGAPPDIPKNATLQFEVKLLTIK
ncbi:peptidylprolyl isomerase fpr4, partial [Physocladia obscura]